MDFGFSEEQLAIRDTIRELVQDRVAPRAAEIDERAEYPKDIEQLFAENGVLAIPFPEEYGGISGSSVTICMGIEEIAKACTTCSLILAVQALGAYPILVAGTEEQKSRLCPPLAQGGRVAAYALSEALEWGIVPETVFRDEGPMGEGSLQRFVEADFEHHYFTLYEDDEGR